MKYLLQASVVAFNLFVGFMFPGAYVWLNFMVAGMAVGFIISFFLSEHRP